MEQRLLALWTKPDTLISCQGIVVHSYALLHMKDSNKRAGKTPASSGKGKGQSLKSEGLDSCNPCSKTFNLENGFQSQAKTQQVFLLAQKK